MSEQAGLPALRRILVALDSDESARAALDAAAELAATLEAELVGLFVEDTDLLEAADLPVTWSIPRHLGPRGAIDSAAMSRALKVSAGAAGEAVAATARRCSVKWYFEIRRGLMVEQVLAEAQGFDLLALGLGGEAMRRAAHEMTGGLMAAPAPGAVLLARGAGCISGPLVVLYDNSERILALGRRMAASQRRRFIVVAVGQDGAEAGERAARAAAWMAEAGVRGSVRRLVLGSPESLCAALQREYPGVLLLDRQGPVAAKISLDDLVREAACSVLVLK